MRPKGFALIHVILATIRQLDAQMQRPNPEPLVLRPGLLLAVGDRLPHPAADAGFYGWRHGPHYAI